MFDDKKRIGDPRIRPVYYVRTGPPSRFSRTRLVWLFRVPRDKRVRRRSAATAAASFAPSDLVPSSLSFHRLLSLHSLLTPYSGPPDSGIWRKKHIETGTRKIYDVMSGSVAGRRETEEKKLIIKDKITGGNEQETGD